MILDCFLQMLLWPGATLSLVLSWFITYQALAFDPSNWRFTLTLRQYEQVRDALLNVVGRTTTSNRLLNDAGKLHVSSVGDMSVYGVAYLQQVL